MPSTCELLGCAGGPGPSAHPTTPALQDEGLLPPSSSRCSETTGSFLRMISGLLVMRSGPCVLNREEPVIIVHRKALSGRSGALWENPKQPPADGGLH